MEKICKQYKESLTAMDANIKRLERENDCKQQTIQSAKRQSFENLIRSKKIDSETRQYLVTKAKEIKTKQSKLKNLYRQMNEKRQQLSVFNPKRTRSVVEEQESSSDSNSKSDKRMKRKQKMKLLR